MLIYKLFFSDNFQTDQSDNVAESGVKNVTNTDVKNVPNTDVKNDLKNVPNNDVQKVSVSGIANVTSDDSHTRSKETSVLKDSDVNEAVDVGVVTGN